MNIVIVPLICRDEAQWLSPTSTPLSCLDNFFRLFLAPPASELREASAAATAEPAEESGGESCPDLMHQWEPNGFLVVDGAGELLRRIARFTLKALDAMSGPEHRVLKAWARLLASRRPISTVWHVEKITATKDESEGPSGADTARQLVAALNSSCDAVVAFEDDATLFRLRAKSIAATRVTELYRSCELNETQLWLQTTWHWDRDADRHCDWLGIAPVNLECRNGRVFGAALMFESQAVIVDQYFGARLCDDLLRHQGLAAKYGDEEGVFLGHWAPTWLESLGFILNAWKQAACDCGNSQPRTCRICTAVDARDWNDVLWHFVERAERYLAKCLGGTVEIDIRAVPQHRKTREEMHPRYLLASTRAIQLDHGFDVIKPGSRGGYRSVYTEVISKCLFEARHSRNAWMDGALKPIARLTTVPAVWTASMSLRRPPVSEDAGSGEQPRP